MRRFLHNNGLSISMFVIFAVTIIGMSIAGWHTNNDERTKHGQSEIAYVGYLGSGDFIEAVFPSLLLV